MLRRHEHGMTPSCPRRLLRQDEVQQMADKIVHFTALHSVGTASAAGRLSAATSKKQETQIQLGLCSAQVLRKRSSS